MVGERQVTLENKYFRIYVSKEDVAGSIPLQAQFIVWECQYPAQSSLILLLNRRASHSISPRQPVHLMPIRELFSFFHYPSVALLD